MRAECNETKAELSPKVCSKSIGLEVNKKSSDPTLIIIDVESKDKLNC